MQDSISLGDSHAPATNIPSRCSEGKHEAPLRPKNPCSSTGTSSISASFAASGAGRIPTDKTTKSNSCSQTWEAVSAGKDGGVYLTRIEPFWPCLTSYGRHLMKVILSLHFS